MTPRSEAVSIVEPQPSWPIEYQELASHLRQALGTVALRIDHIGSTSIPGLAAKDVIDVQVAVANSHDLDVALDLLASEGWSVRRDIRSDHLAPGGPADPEQWTKRYSRERLGERRSNIHIRVKDHANHRYALVFRDYLRAHQTTAAAHSNFKRAAATLLSADLNSYAHLKDPVCDLIYLPAQRWAEETMRSQGSNSA